MKRQKLSLFVLTIVLSAVLTLFIAYVLRDLTDWIVPSNESPEKYYDTSSLWDSLGIIFVRAILTFAFLLLLLMIFGIMAAVLVLPLVPFIWNDLRMLWHIHQVRKQTTWSSQDFPEG